jgi:hypothetical protein
MVKPFWGKCSPLMVDDKPLSFKSIQEAQDFIDDFLLKMHKLIAFI